MYIQHLTDSSTVEIKINWFVKFIARRILRGTFKEIFRKKLLDEF